MEWIIDDAISAANLHVERDGFWEGFIPEPGTPDEIIEQMRAYVGAAMPWGFEVNIEKSGEYANLWIGVWRERLFDLRMQ